jgi:hypothetical protein
MQLGNFEQAVEIAKDVKATDNLESLNLCARSGTVGPASSGFGDLARQSF